MLNEARSPTSYVFTGPRFNFTVYIVGGSFMLQDDFNDAISHLRAALVTDR
jgi:hypothetical protein